MGRVTRPYDNRLRRARADATQQRIIDAAGDCFRESGYAATTLATVATQAGVSVETIKKSMGTKRALLRRWFDQCVAGPEAVPPTEAAWLSGLSATSDLSERIAIAAASLAETYNRAAAAVAVVTAAAHADPDIAAMWSAERRQRYSDVETIVTTVVSGLVTSPLERQTIDAVYALSEAHLFMVLVEERGWTADQYAAWFSSALSALLTPLPESTPHIPTRQNMETT